MKKHWYKSWWGATLIVVLYIFVVAVIAFGLLIYNYWHQIKNGQGAILQKNFYQQTAEVESPEILKARAQLETTDDPALGNPNADLVIVEFLDFKCPICRAQAPIMQKLAAKYGYKIRIIFRDFPIESTHPGTSQLASIASCAAEQGGYWPFADYFFANQDALTAELTDEQINLLTDEFGLDKMKMKDCLVTERGRNEWRKDYQDAVLYGLKEGTPTFFINGYIFAGAIPFDKWEEIIKSQGLAN